MKKYNEKGFALPMVMIAILAGALIIPAFLGHVGTSLIGSRNYRSSLDAQYACDSGAEHAVWGLVYGNIAAGIPEAGNSTAYTLGETVNGLDVNVKVSNAYEIIARDDFNSGDWVGGSGWLGDWSYSGDALVTATGTPYEGAYHLRLRSSTGVVSRAVDLSQQIDAHLTFWTKMNSLEPSNTIVCRVSHDGSGWTTIKTWTQADSDNAYHYNDLDLTAYGLTSDFYISFVSNMNSTNDYFYVDDLKIVWPAAVPTLIAADDFESGGWSGGSVWLGDWTHTGAASVNTTGTPYSGSYHLQILGPDGYAARAVDLSSVSVARLQFRAKADSFESGEEAYCRVSSDGSSWNTLHTWVNGDDDGIYRYYDLDISGYDLTSNFWIAFNSGMNEADDYFYVDDVTVTGINAYCITVTAGDRILKVAVDLMDGDKKVLCWSFIG